jgi:type IV pilus assembly protein PilA
MKPINFNRQPPAFSLIELMVILCILSILAAVAIPNYIRYRNKAFCIEAENDAQAIAAAISDYFGATNRFELPVIDDLNLNLKNKVGVTITGDSNTMITIKVPDSTRQCPISYQNAHPEWDSNFVYTKTIR